MAKSRKPTTRLSKSDSRYSTLVSGISDLLKHARRTASRAINGILTATYWEVGRRVVEFEQGGQARAEYGAALLKRLAQDLTTRVGRGFSERNLEYMRRFYLGWQISQTVSAKWEVRVMANEPIAGRPDVPLPRLPESAADVLSLASAFPLPWSHYVRLLPVENLSARRFYEVEALRGGWSVRQLDRQIGSQFYERTALSKRKAAMLEKGQMARPEDAVTPEEEIRNPYLLEFLDLKDEYSESDLEEALIRHMETFLLVFRQSSIDG